MVSRAFEEAKENGGKRQLPTDLAAYVCPALLVPAKDSVAKWVGKTPGGL